uniref:Uncharacterized protein n=1 Tax=Anguilla anguilla TaxID=7936 RepID=A0A0E9QKL3_ANGAN
MYNCLPILIGLHLDTVCCIKVFKNVFVKAVKHYSDRAEVTKFTAL